MSLYPNETDLDVVAEAVTASSPSAQRTFVARASAVAAVVCFSALAICGALAFVAVAEQLVGVR